MLRLCGRGDVNCKKSAPGVQDLTVVAQNAFYAKLICSPAFLELSKLFATAGVNTEASKRTGGKLMSWLELRGQNMDRTDARSDVQGLYEAAPYPDLGAELKDPSAMLLAIHPHLRRPEGEALNYLEAGCGTGHYLVGVAKRLTHWTCAGIDLSSASLSVAKQLAQNHNVSVELHQKSYLEPLPFETAQFDIISAQGTIHHCDDPVGALKNLKSYLKDDGIITMHVYGRRLDAGKFDLKEAISIFEPNLNAHENRFNIYQALIRHEKQRSWWKDILDTSPLGFARWVRKSLRNFYRRSQSVSWSPPWTDVYKAPTSPWKDHFCHPCERAYEVPDLKALVTGAGLKVIAMRAQGKVDKALVPPELRKDFDGLSDWDQWRLMELLGPARSFAVLLRKE